MSRSFSHSTKIFLGTFPKHVMKHWQNEQSRRMGPPWVFGESIALTLRPVAHKFESPMTVKVTRCFQT